MTIFRRLAHWLGSGTDANLREEIESHRALIQADFESRGFTPADAARASRRAMGSVMLACEDVREVWVITALDRVWRDARHGARSLLRERTFAGAAMLTLALGVATTSTVFSVVDAELWKPLPFPDPDRLVGIRVVGTGGPRDTQMSSGSELLDWTRASGAFAGFAGIGRTGRRVLRRDTAESVLVTQVTPTYFRTLGRAPIAGRTFDATTDSNTPAAVVTDRTWRRLFAGEADVVGLTISLDEELIPIVGVIATDDSLGPAPDLYVSIPPSSREFQDRTARMLNVIGRLRPEVDLAAARAELQALVGGESETGADRPSVRTVEVTPLAEYYRGYNWRPLYFFLGAALVVLLLSAINVASLLLARAFGRAREFAVRGALGGGRQALARQLLVEGALIALPGGMLGLLFTRWAVAFFATRLPSSYVTGGTEIPVDVRVAMFALAATAITALVFGLAPMWFADRVDLTLILGRGGRTRSGAREHTAARHALLVAQVALTVVLLVGAGIFLKSYRTLTRIPLGFDAQDRMAARLSLSGPRYASDGQIVSFADALLERTRALPGVRQATVASSSPLGSGPIVFFVSPDRPRPARGTEPRAILRAVGTGYFRSLGIRLVRGREFSAEDTAAAPRVAVVNEHLTRHLFEGTDPVGRVIELLPGARAPWTRRPGRLFIVGVASNVKEVGFNEVDFNDIYVPFAQAPPPSLEVIVHTAEAAGPIAEGLRTAVADIDRNVPVLSIIPFGSRVADALTEDRFNLLLIASFAAVALLLAAIGIYGGVAYAVHARTHEFSIRLALGAPPRHVVAAALMHGARFAVLGGAAGVVASLAIARLLGNALYLVPGSHNGLLYGVTTTDPAALLGACAGIAAVALAASAIPARRIAQADPLVTLRQE